MQSSSSSSSTNYSLGSAQVAVLRGAMRGGYAAGCSQQKKTMQSKGVFDDGSLLAFPSTAAAPGTAMATTFSHPAQDFSRPAGSSSSPKKDTRYIPPSVLHASSARSGEGVGAGVGEGGEKCCSAPAVVVGRGAYSETAGQHDSCDYTCSSCGNSRRVGNTKTTAATTATTGYRRQSASSWSLSCFLTVVLWFGFAALCGVCVHLYSEVRELRQQNEKTWLSRRYADNDERFMAQLEKMVATSLDSPPPPQPQAPQTQHSNPATPTMRTSGNLLQLLTEGRSARFLNIRKKRNAGVDPGISALRTFVETTVLNYLQDMPKVQLRGLRNAHEREYRTPVDHGNFSYLVWQPDSESPVHFSHRGVGFVHVHNQHNRIKAIRINENGIYLVYAQVVVNGTSIPSWRRDCAHQTVMIPHHDPGHHRRRRRHQPPPPPRVLMSGFVTQDNQGRYENDSIPYPRDSALLFGIFRLTRQTQIAVRVHPTEDCRRTLITTDLDSSIFGLYRLA